MKYRKKPVEIEAFQFKGEQSGEYYIRTLEGNHHISHGDYVIKGVKGELYPCKPDIFEMTYEPVGQESI